MILGMHGFEFDEKSLSEKCRATDLGTSANDVVEAARGLGLSARKEYSTVDALRAYLERDLFPIMFINLLAIDGFNTTHAVIAQSISDSEISIIDPRLGNRTIDLEIMRYSWQRAKNVAIVIEKS
jgi:ABC-type bacteriocin/lantibiotic exporter with double-glycine peptidase domain